ncbi:MAG: glycosyltransferase [Pseudomonadota bacterium]
MDENHSPGAKVGIIIPTYNYGRFLDECLGAVIAQTYGDFSVLVIDNASEDDTEVIMRAWTARDGRIRYLRNETNLGLRASLNKAYALVGGELVTLLSADDHWEPTFLEKTVAALVAHPECSFAYTGWRMYVDRPGAANHGAEIRVFVPHVASGVQDDATVLLAHNWITNSICLFRRQVCDAIGGITPAQLHHVGDWYLWMCFLTRGPAYYIHERLGHYRKHGEAETERLIADNLSGYDHLHFYDLIFQSEAWPMPVRLLAKVNQIRWLTGEPLLDIAQKLGGERATPLMREYVAPHRDDLLVGAAKTVLEYVPTPNALDSTDKAIALLNEVLARSPGHAGARAVLAAHTTGTGLAGRRPRILVYSGDDTPWACAQIRLIQPIQQLAGEFELVWGVKPKGDGKGHYSDLALLQSADLVIIQRYYVLEDNRDYVECILNSGRPVVYEMDDLLFELPPDNPHHASAHGSREFILSVIERVDAVVVSTRALAEAVQSLARPKQVYVLANAIDPAPMLREPVIRSGPVRIGLAGTPTHQGDYALVEQALGRVLSKYHRRVMVVFMGATPERWRNHAGVTGIEFVPDYRLYARTLPRLELDIALVPLEDNAFNRCKSAIKWLEYAAVGAAGIYSDVQPYAEIRDGVTGLKVANTPDAWYAALCDLIEHPAKRLALAKAAQQEVLAQHSITVRARDYAQVYGALARSPHAGDATSGFFSGATPAPAEAVPAAQLYEVWQAAHAPQPRDAEWVAERLPTLAKPPRFHLGLIALAENEAGLATTIESLGQQFYADWRLTIVAESPAPAALDGQDKIHWLQAGEGTALAVLNQALLAIPANWAGMLEAGDRLAPHALFAFADKLDRHPDWQLAYSDEDSLAGDGRRDLPFFKTDFNLEMLRAAPFTLGGLMLTRHDLFVSLGGYQVELEGAETYDLALRAWERCGTPGIGHVADVLYHRFIAGGHSRRPAEIIQVARRVALDEHCLRLGIQAEFEDGRLPGTTRVRYRHAATPLVSILIPTRNQVQFLQRCLETLIEKTAYAHYEVLVLDNGSDEAQAVGYLNTLRRAPADRLRVIDCPGPFNFSAINNRGVREARGDYLVLLNNDTAVLEGDWLDELLALGQLPDVGVVGARLLFPNGRIQHAGVILGINDTVADHPFIDHAADEAGYFGRLLLPQDLSAVTAACLLVKKSVYTGVGGLDEDDFKVSFNDIDFCLKVREAGHRIVWTPYATLLHEGSASQTQKGVEPTEDAAKRERFRGEREAMFRKWPRWIAFDPAYNRNLSSVGRDFLVELAPPLTWDPEWRPRPRVLAHPADRMGCGEYRIISPMRALNDAGRLMGWETGKYLSIPELLRMEPDSVVFQRQVEWSQIELMESYIRHSPAFRVFEIDDLITNVPVKSSRKKVFVEQKDLIKRFRKAVSLCHRFVVSTEYLAEEYRGYTDQVIAVPNYLEDKRWRGFTPKRRQGGKPRVGWAGSTSHDGDLAEIIDVVKATAEEVDWVFFGMCPKEIRPLLKEFHEPVALDDYPAKLASLDLDLAVAPLEDVPFNHGKSHLRLLEYGVMGYPVICTDITPYRGAYPVTRVPNRFKDWVEAIREHVSDLDALARRGDALRDHIHAEWMLGDHLDVWLRAWLPD